MLRRDTQPELRLRLEMAPPRKPLSELRDQDGVIVRPHAIIDTNVRLAIYSWHDLYAQAEAVNAKDSAADLSHPEIQPRAKRARSSFLLSLLFNDRKWVTVGPSNELKRTIVLRADPTNSEHHNRVAFVALYIYFIKEKILPDWRDCGDEDDDQELKGNDVDLICLERAEKHNVPLISWEGTREDGTLNSGKLIPREALLRGVDLVSPDQLLERERFDPSVPLRRFFADWDRHVGHYIKARGGAAELVIVRQFYERMAEDYWGS